MSKLRQTRFERLKTVYEELAVDFGNSGEPHLKAWGETYREFLGKLPELSDSNGEAPSRSELASGMEQGLRDMALMLRGFPEGPRRQGLAIVRSAIDSHYPDFFEKDRLRLAKVVQRGSVRTEDEWYLVRSRVDEIEGIDDAVDELSILNRLMDEFAGAA